MNLFFILLILHVISGASGLLLGTFVLIRKKGDALHKKLGYFFVISMTTTGLIALVLSYLHPSLFLFIVGVFTVYLTLSGYRMVRLKKHPQGKKPEVFDVIITSLMLISSLSFLFYGTQLLISGEKFGGVLLLFGGISLRMCYLDYRIFTYKVTQPLYWLKNHLGRMTGAYIAAFTAFLVVNNTYLPGYIAWSLPSIIGVAFIIRNLRKLSPKK